LLLFYKFLNILGRCLRKAGLSLSQFPFAHILVENVSCLPKLDNDHSSSRVFDSKFFGSISDRFTFPDDLVDEFFSSLYNGKLYLDGDLSIVDLLV